jgi:arylsulfatase A-like enzyme
MSWGRESNGNLARCALAYLRACCAGGALSLVAAAQAWTGQTPRVPGASNVLIVVADDVGIDLVGAWGVADAPPTPTIDKLALNGVRFTRAYAQPVCSPTRATILTGRYGFRTLIGSPIRANNFSFALPLSERTLAEVLASGTSLAIANGAIGKWHLGSLAVGGASNPALQGFQWFAGTLANLAGNESYFSYMHTVNGVEQLSARYATSEQTDDAIARIHAMSEPWFLYLAYNAPHQPFHAPPPALHSYALSGDPDATPQLHARAAMQALDTELGRLLASIPAAVLARTTILLLGDNGTDSPVAEAPFAPERVKGTMYEGGVHVPLLAWGRRVASPGRVCDALVNTVDLFPTVLDLFGDQADIALPKQLPIDGVSLLPYIVEPFQRPLREYVYADRFSPNGPGPYAFLDRMVRDQRWKLIVSAGAGDELYDVGDDLVEGDNLLEHELDAEQLAAYARLTVVLDDMLATP